MTHRFIFAVLGTAIAVAAPARAQAPRLIAFSGVLTGPHGAPAPDAPYAVEFSLYPQPSGGSPAWTETKALTVSGGRFATALGDATPLPTGLDFSAPWFVGVRVGADEEMTPRLALHAAPLSLLSLDVPRNPALLANASGGAMSTDGQDVAMAGELRFGGANAWAPVGAAAPLQMVAGQLDGATGAAASDGYTSRRVSKGVYEIGVSGMPASAAFIATVVGSGSWTASIASVAAGDDGVRLYKVETRLSAFLTDPQALNFMVTGSR
jgi:hypothetical protein